MQQVNTVSTGNSLIRPCISLLDAIYSKHNCNDFITTLNNIEVNLFNDTYESIDSFKQDLLEINELTEKEINSIDINVEKELPEEYCITPIYSSVNLKKESLMYSVHINKHQNLHCSLYEAVKNFNPTIKSPQTSPLLLHRLYTSKSEKLMLEARNNINAVLFLFFDVELNATYDDPNMSHISATTAVVYPLGNYHHVATVEDLTGWIKVKIVQTNYINTRIPTKLAHRLFEKKEQQVRKVSIKTATDAESAKVNETTRQFVYNIMGLRVDQFESYDLPVVENMLHNTKYTPKEKKMQPNNNNINNNNKKAPTVKFLCKPKATISSPAPTNTNATSTVITLPNLYQSASKMLSLLTSSNKPTNNKTTTEEITADEPTVDEQCIEKSPIYESSSIEEPTIDEPDMENLKSDETATEETTMDEAKIIEPSTTDEPSIEKLPVATHWKRLEKFCNEKNVELVPRSEFDSHISRNNDAEGHFKQVYFTQDNNVVQIFQRSTALQRVIEIASLLTLKDKEHIGRIKKIIYDDANTEVIGLTMDRYDMTLKDYLRQHTHHRLLPQQRMQIIVQMLKSIQVIHQLGIAHRDLSTVNFMINVNKDQELQLYLIDFGKVVFMFPRDAKRWWVNTDDLDVYQDEVKPATKEELAIWCRNLPYVMARPDHGYRFYRSIQTLPKNNKDHDLLPYLIDPAAEDVYSLGTMIWKVFSGIEPWPGVFDTDLKKLRETVGSDYIMDDVLDRVMPGPTSKILLQKFLRVDPLGREPVAKILDWIQRDDIKQELLNEWALEGSRRPSAKARAVAPESKRSSVKAKVSTPEPAVKKSRPIAEPKRTHARNRVTPEPSVKKVPVQTIPLPTTTTTTTLVRKFFKSGKPMGRPSNAIKKEQVEPHKAKSYFPKSGLPVGRPPRKRGFVEEEFAEKEERPPRKTVAKSAKTLAPKMHCESIEVKPLIKNIKQLSKSGIGSRTRSHDVIAKTEEVPKTVYDVPVIAKKVYPSTYVKTGKRRGRPKKVSRGVPNSNSAIVNKDQSLNKDEEPTTIQQINNMVEEPPQQISMNDKPLLQQMNEAPSQQLAKEPPQQQMNKVEPQKINHVPPPPPTQLLEKPITQTIRLPGRPKTNLNKQTWELINRCIPTTVRDQPKKLVSPPPLQTDEPLFSPQPTSSRLPSLSPTPPPLLPQFSKQSSQSTYLSLLSPVSNTEDETPSPTSPLSEGKKRKMVDDQQQEENVKRRHTENDQQQQEQQQSITQTMEANIDEFDRALYNILQNYDLNNNC